MASSYAFAAGSVRARETTLLTRQDMDGLLLAADQRELASLLRDKGYGDPAAPGETVDDLLRQETARLWEYLLSIAPDTSVFDGFLYRSDLHNAKALLKGIMAGRSPDRLLLPAGTVPVELLADAVAERRFHVLPGWLAGAMEEAYDLLAHARDAGLADAVLDRAAMAAMLAAADRTRDEIVRQVFQNLVFYNDVKIALRAARTGKGSLYLERALCPCDGMDDGEWIRAVRGGEEEFLALLERRDVYGSRSAAEAYRAAPSVFEKWVDDRLIETARRAHTVTVGPAPLVGYLLGKETEIKALHMLASGIRTGQDPDTIRERGRRLYA